MIEHIEKQISEAILALQDEVHDLSGIVLQNRMDSQFPTPAKSLTLVAVPM